MNGHQWNLSRASRIIAATIVALVAVGSTTATQSQGQMVARAETSYSNAGVAEAKASVARARRPVSWKQPGPPIANLSRVKGKTFFYIANGLDLPPIQALIQGLKAGAKAAGMRVQVADGRGDPAEISRQMDRAVGQKSAVVATTSFEASSISAAIQHAKQAGVRVILGFGGDPGLPTAADRRLGVSAYVTFDYSGAGRLLGDEAVADSNGKADAAVFDVPESPNAVLEGRAAVNEIHRLCSACKVTLRHAPLVQWTTNLQTLTSSTLKADPNINYLIPVWDPMVPFMKPAVAALNAQNRVKILTYNADTPQLADLQKGDIVAVDIGSPEVWVGWGMMDQALRVLSGMKAVVSENIPNRVLDRHNLSALHLNLGESAAAEKIRYGVDFVTRYKRLWGAR